MSADRILVDAFPFYTELDLLEARIDYLKDVVDLFVLVECDRNHANQPVERMFWKHRQRFTEKFPGVRIRCVHFDALPHTASNWPRVYAHRNAILDGLSPSGASWSTVYVSDADGGWQTPGGSGDAATAESPLLAEVLEDAIVLISDVDEFPPWEYLQALKSGHLNFTVPGAGGNGVVVNALDVLAHGKVFRFEGAFFYYDLYTRNRNNWGNSRVALASSVRHFSPECVRRAMPCRCGVGPSGELCYCENSFFGQVSGGWHFSYFGGAEAVRNKIRSIAESAFLATDDFTDLDRVTARMARGGDLYDRANEGWCRLAAIPEDVPREVVQRFPGLAVEGDRVGTG